MIALQYRQFVLLVEFFSVKNFMRGLKLAMLGFNILQKGIVVRKSQRVASLGNRIFFKNFLRVFRRSGSSWKSKAPNNESEGEFRILQPLRETTSEKRMNVSKTERIASLGVWIRCTVWNRSQKGAQIMKAHLHAKFFSERDLRVGNFVYL